MAHLDPDRLILLALGEQEATPADTAHLDQCHACRRQLEGTRTVVTLGREGASLRDLPAPPPAVWDRIAAEALGHDAGNDAAPTSEPGSARATAPPSVPRARRPGGWTRRARLALAGAACVVLGALGATGIPALLSDGETAQVLAQAELTPQPGAPATAHGVARVIDTGHGRRLEVTIDGVPDAPSGYYTVWMYDGHDVMIPLGSPGSEPLNIPPAADDIDDFHIVDVSAQRLGQQEHGRSVLQGSFDS